MRFKSLRKSTLYALMVTTFVTLATSFAFGAGGTESGGNNGGGGVAIRCGNHIEMLDVFEARKSGQKLLASPQSQLEAITLVAELMARHFNSGPISAEPLLKSALQKNIIQPIFEQKPITLDILTNETAQVEFVNWLPLSNDYGRYDVPAGCGLEQAAYFSDRDMKLSIVQPIWNEFDWMSKSVLVAHEVLYEWDRTFGVSNLDPHKGNATSKETRKFIGHLFGADSSPGVLYGMPTYGKVMICGLAKPENGKQTRFYAFNDTKSGKLTLIFNVLMGEYSFYQLRSNFKTLSVNFFDEKSDEAAIEITEIQKLGLDEKARFKAKLSKLKNAAPQLQIFFVDGQGHELPGSRETLSCFLKQ